MTKDMNIIHRIFNNNKRAIPDRIPSPADLMVPFGESSIEWIQDPARYPFVRVLTVLTKTRYQRPHLYNGGKVIGFSVVGDLAPANNGKYLRRAFFLYPGDIRALELFATVDSNIALPVDAVRPLTIQPGRWGVRS